MNYVELKLLLSRVAFKLFHEVQDYKDYYFCFMRKNELSPELISLLDKHQSITKKEFQKICHSQTADILEMSDDPENNAYVYFVDILDIRSPEYIQQSLFLYKHIANIVCFKLLNSYFDEKTFKIDLGKVLSPTEEFKYIKHGKNSPSGHHIENGDYQMFDAQKKKLVKEETDTSLSSKSIEEVLQDHQKNKNTLEKEFNINDFEKIGMKRSSEEDFSDKFFNRVDSTTSLLSDVVSEASQNIKKKVIEKAPVVKKNATVVGKFIGKNIVKAVNKGGELIEQKIKEDKIRRLKHSDLFDLDNPSNKAHINNNKDCDNFVNSDVKPDTKKKRGVKKPKS